MPEITPHIGLKKPLASDTADISVINDNMDMIDIAFGDLSAVPTAAKDAAGALTELHAAIQQIDVDISDGSITPAKLSFDPATQTELDAHVNATNVHGATNAPTASRLILRDAAGRAKVAAPAASDDIARLDSITKAQAGLGSVAPCSVFHDMHTRRINSFVSQKTNSASTSLTSCLMCQWVASLRHSSHST